MKLARHEWGSFDEPFQCRAPDCRRDAIASGMGHALPFCKAHTEKLPRRLFNDLVALSSASPFDTLRVGTCERAVVAAIRSLLGATRPR